MSWQDETRLALGWLTRQLVLPSLSHTATPAKLLLGPENTSRFSWDSGTQGSFHPLLTARSQYYRFFHLGAQVYPRRASLLGCFLRLSLTAVGSATPPVNRIDTACVQTLGSIRSRRWGKSLSQRPGSHQAVAVSGPLCENQFRIRLLCSSLFFSLFPPEIHPTCLALPLAIAAVRRHCLLLTSPPTGTLSARDAAART